MNAVKAERDEAWGEVKRLLAEAEDRDKAAPQVAVPERHALVPVEPTPEILAAFADSVLGEGSYANAEPEDNEHFRSEMGKAWAAMLAAAPTAPAGEPGMHLPDPVTWEDCPPQPVSDPYKLLDRVLMPRALTAENGAKTALMGEFFVSGGERCANCGHPGFEGDDCALCGCDQSEPWNIPVPWTAIKRIYTAAVELLATPSPAGKVVRDAYRHGAGFMSVSEGGAEHLPRESVKAAPAPDEREIAAKALSDVQTQVMHGALDDEIGRPSAAAVSRMLGAEITRLRAGKEGGSDDQLKAWPWGTTDDGKEGEPS
ncbi:MAG: hypothetical protein Q7Q73_05805 [Verrucomicrobiota bacterium JB024]|nr:hypothetical protein [Verrucomicrobiota bacterium JB024]